MEDFLKSGNPLESTPNALFDALQCPVCHDIFVDPLILECGHLFCTDCLESWFDVNKDCPVCRLPNATKPILCLVVKNLVNCVVENYNMKFPNEKIDLTKRYEAVFDINDMWIPLFLGDHYECTACRKDILPNGTCKRCHQYYPTCDQTLTHVDLMLDFRYRHNQMNPFKVDILEDPQSLQKCLLHFINNDKTSRESIGHIPLNIFDNENPIIKIRRRELAEIRIRTLLSAFKMHNVDFEPQNAFFYFVDNIDKMGEQLVFKYLQLEWNFKDEGKFKSWVKFYNECTRVKHACMF